MYVVSGGDLNDIEICTPTERRDWGFLSGFVPGRCCLGTSAGLAICRHWEVSTRVYFNELFTAYIIRRMERVATPPRALMFTKATVIRHKATVIRHKASSYQTEGTTVSSARQSVDWCSLLPRTLLQVHAAVPPLHICCGTIGYLAFLRFCTQFLCLTRRKVVQPISALPFIFAGK
jgi:hypothetical protein